MSTVLRTTVTPTEAPRRSRGIWLFLLFLLVVLVAAALAFLIWQPASRLASRSTEWPAATGAAAVPSYSSAQGAQDAPRSETMSGRSRDYDACMETLRLRRVVFETAKDTCTKMVIGLYGK